MRKIEVKKGDFVLKEEVEVVLEKKSHTLSVIQQKLMYQRDIWDREHK
ncbi:hypothetical protein AIOGIFDO_00830 [Candidatus Methanoperedenaceae archaeon GB37]|nr:hypothetical protein AIOGIFDO_00830 [Candidatus Methanoperedenaceae archaeon GB37]